MSGRYNEPIEMQNYGQCKDVICILKIIGEKIVLMKFCKNKGQLSYHKQNGDDLFCLIFQSLDLSCSPRKFLSSIDFPHESIRISLAKTLFMKKKGNRLRNFNEMLFFNAD